MGRTPKSMAKKGPKPSPPAMGRTPKSMAREEPKQDLPAAMGRAPQPAIKIVPTSHGKTSQPAKSHSPAMEIFLLWSTVGRQYRKIFCRPWTAEIQSGCLFGRLWCAVKVVLSPKLRVFVHLEFLNILRHFQSLINKKVSI